MSDHPRIPLAGVIGSPVAHSRSPALHGYWLRHYGIRGHYIPMDVAADDLETVLRALPRRGLSAVTSRSRIKRRFWLSPM